MSGSLVSEEVDWDSARSRTWPMLVGVASVLLPAFICLALILRRRIDGSVEGVRYGYAFALTIFAVPLAIHGLYAARAGRGVRTVWPASFWMTILTTFMIGLLLDVGFGGFFLKFPSDHGVVGIKVIGYVPGYGFRRYIPIEEFAFYVLGMMWIVSSYSFFDRFVFVRALRRTPARIRELVQISRSWLFAITLMAAIACVASVLSRQDGSVFPGYALFVLATTGTPPVLLWRKVGSTLNMPALVATLALITISSIVWEPSLGIPLGWWGYNDAYMCGIRFDAWASLPIEAVLFWWASGLTGSLVFETARSLRGDAADA